MPRTNYDPPDRDPYLERLRRARENREKYWGPKAAETWTGLLPSRPDAMRRLREAEDAEDSALDTKRAQREAAEKALKDFEDAEQARARFKKKR